MADDGTSWPAGSENATGERLDEPSADAPRRRSKVAPEREDIIPPMLRRVLEAGIRVDAPASAMGSRFAERDERAAGEADVIERGREALDYADRGPSEHHDVDAAGYSEERLRLRYVTTASTDPVVSQPRWYSLHDSDDAHANHAEAALPISSAGGRPTARPAVKSKTYSWPPKPRN